MRMKSIREMIFNRLILLSPFLVRAEMEVATTTLPILMKTAANMEAPLNRSLNTWRIYVGCLSDVLRH